MIHTSGSTSFDDGIDTFDIHPNMNDQHSFHSSSTSGLDMEQLLRNFDENDPIFNNELLYPTPQESEILHFNDDGDVISGTVEALITYITSPDVLNYQFLIDLFLTFRSYMDPLPLLELLLCRLSWSLKKSLSDEPEGQFNGRLILIRTFVTIRHWLLNHFQDDFINNIVLRSLFTNTINEFAKMEKYRGDGSGLQGKVLKDLKKVYLTLAAIYWDVDFDEYDLLNVRISSYNELNSSRLSILGLNQLNDPSTRRSTLLYMLENPNSTNALNDLKKCTGTNIFNLEKDKKSNDEKKISPLESYLQKKAKYTRNVPGQLKGKKNGNTVLNPKDSLNLFEIKKIQNSGSLNSIDQMYTTLLDNNTSVLGFVDLNKKIGPNESNGSGDSRYGFTTSGNIMIFSDSKVDEIRSSSNDVGDTENKELVTAKDKLIVKTSHKNTAIQDRGKNRIKAKKRSYIKSLFLQNNKENMYHITPPTKEDDDDFDRKKKFDTDPSEVISFMEKEIDVDQNSIDYLEELLIRDYQIIIQHPSFKQRFSKQFRNSKRHSVLSVSFDYGDRESRFNPLDSPTKHNLFGYDQGDIENSMNFSKLKGVDKSFASPTGSIDWSDSMNVDEISNDHFVDMNGVLVGDVEDVNSLDDLESRNDGVIIYCEDGENSVIDANSEIQSHNTIPHRSIDESHNISQNRSSLQPVSQSNRLSTVSRRAKCISDSRILVNANVSRQSRSYLYEDFDTSSIGRNSRFSVKMLKRDSGISTKSYMTYDSQFSESSNLSTEQYNNANTLNRKNAISNLRVNNIIMTAGEEEDTNSSIHDAVIGSFNETTDTVDVNEAEIVYQERKSIDALSYLQKLPYFGYVSSNPNVESTLSIIPSPSGSQACYNALSPDDINDLAAIPDQTLDGDPLNYTLSKLRGERAKAKVIIGLNDTKISEEETHRKHAVAVVCESPNRNRNTEYMGIDDTIGSEGQISEDDLNRQVRDLLISSKPMEENKLEMSLVSVNNLGKRTKDTASILTRVSTGQLLRDETEKSHFEIHSMLATPKVGLETTKPLLSVTQILDQQLHIPFIFKYDSEVLAQQMTLIEKDIIMEVDWKELINLKWDQPLTPYNSWLRLLIDLSDKSGLELITLRFNLVNNWIISEILLCRNHNLRILAITRFIQLAQKCREIQNYGTLFQIMLALNSEVMKKLKSTWIRVDPGTILKFKELKDLTSPNNDFENYRNEIEKVIPSKGFIPFLPLGLSDLTMYSEMSTILPSTDIDELDSLVGFENESIIAYDLINFKKFSHIGETVKKILRYIEWSKFYNFNSNQEVLSKCLYISSLSEEDMSICLQSIDI